jgi:hydroxyethylthiazole kinase-like uncharacterized protein yjeF
MTVPLYNLATLRAVEQHARSDLPAGELMRRAGKAAADFIWKTSLSGFVKPSAAVFAGPGDNGGDAFVVAYELLSRGVNVTMLATSVSRTEDAQRARQQWSAVAPTHPLYAACKVTTAHAVVDGLLGIGLAGAPRSEIADAILQVNRLAAAGSIVTALDIPSGLNGWTGQPTAPSATVRAHQTITFISGKPGLYTGEGAKYCGTVVIDSLSLPNESSGVLLTEARDFAAQLHERSPTQHKGQSGNLLILGGAFGMTGAALLAGRAALATGVGRLFIALEDSRLPVDPIHPEAMLSTWDTLPGAVDAAVVGCGLSNSEPAQRALAALLSAPVPIVIDADALNLIATHADLRNLITQRTADTVITPHPLEGARLLSTTTQQVQSDRITAAQQLSTAFRCVAVLKGSGTIIARPDGICFINPTGNAALATGGTGDLLAGAIGALMASGVPAREAALAAVYAHGLAAERVCQSQRGMPGLTSAAFLSELTQTLNELRSGNA